MLGKTKKLVKLRSLHSIALEAVPVVLMCDMLYQGTGYDNTK